jgi:hypothetical protein
VTESGEFHFIQSDEVQYFGTLRVTGNSVTGDFTGVAPLGTTFVDGSVTGSGTLTGTITARASFTGTTTFRTSRGTTLPSAAFALAFNALYNRPSSLSTIAGTYRDLVSGSPVLVSSTGAISQQDPLSGCTVSGQASIIDPSFNAYRVRYTFAGCRGADAILNGTTANGLATLDDTISPETAVIGVVNAQVGYSLVGEYPRAVTPPPPSNSPPIFTTSSLSYSVPCGGGSVSGQVRATDANGDALTYGPTTPQPTQGTMTVPVNAQGQFTYRTNTTCSATTDTFGVTVGDGRGGTTTATVTITITPVPNQPPVLTSSSLAYTVACGGASVSGQVAATDPNGDTLTFGPTNPQPTQGTLTSAVSAAGQFTYRSNPTCSASADTFGVTVGDGRGGTATGTVTLTITPAPNQAPTLTSSSLMVTTPFNTAVNAAVQASDPNGDLLTFTFGAPSAGTLSNTTVGGGYTYTPATNFAGTATFSVSVSDGRGGVAQGVVTVTVNPQAAGAPVAREDVFRATISGSQTVTLNVLQNDQNVATPTITVSAISLPGATITQSGTNVVLDVGQADFVGFVRFTYNVQTAAGNASARAVAFVNTEPVRAVYLSAPSPRDAPGAANEVWTHDFLGARRVAVIDQGQEVNYRNRPPALQAAANAPLAPTVAYLASGNGVRDRLFVARLDLTDAPVALPLPAGTNVGSFAVSPNGLYIAVVACTTANAATQCGPTSTFNLYVFTAANLTTLPSPAYTASGGSIQSLDVSFGPSSNFVYLNVVRQTFSNAGAGGNYATGAYIRLSTGAAVSPSTLPTWTGVFPSDPSASVRGFRCVTSRDETTHVCSGNPSTAATQDRLYVVRGTPFVPQEISGPLAADQSVDIRFAVNPQFTRAAYPTNSEPCCTNRRLYTVTVPATQVNPGDANAVDPVPGTTRQAILPIGFSRDGTALAARENQGGPLLTFVGRSTSSPAFQLQPLGPTTAGRISTQPAFAADARFTYVVDAPANTTRGDLLRATGTGAPAKVDNLNGIFFYSVATTQQDRAASADNGGVLAIQGDSPALAGVDSIVLASASTYAGAITESPPSTGRTLLLPIFAEFWSVQAARTAP